MTLVETLVVVVVVVVVIAGVALRVRKLLAQRDFDQRARDDRHLVVPPPSPYEPSKGFRLVDGSSEPLVRPPVARPRLDPGRHYVFNDAQAGVDDVVSTPLRHSDKWFLSQYAHRSPASRIMRRSVVIVLVVLVVVVVVAYYVNRHTPTSPSPGSGSPSTSHALSSTSPSTRVLRASPVSTSGFVWSTSN